MNCEKKDKNVHIHTNIIQNEIIKVIVHILITSPSG